MSRALTSLFERWTSGERSASLYAFAAAAAPASLLYRLGVSACPPLRKRYPRPSKARLIVVSSPMVGGVGKTPLTALIARSLKTRGFAPALVTLGHGRRSKGRASLSTANPEAPVSMTGDEAAELFNLTQIPTYVDDDPADAINNLDREGLNDWIVFDDGVSRMWNEERRVAVVSATDLVAPVRYLPFGRWRTSPNFLLRASYVAVTFTDDRPSFEMIRRRLGEWGYSGAFGVFEYRANGIVRYPKHDAESLPTGTPHVFCGIGRPHRFRQSVDLLGYGQSPISLFPDHHDYTQSDWIRLEKTRSDSGCTWFLTTLKDAVRLDSAWTASTPTFFLRIALNQVHGPEIVAALTKDD